MAHAHHHLGADKVVKGETPHASSDMNVTPLIDVLLVLLVIFMAALPLTQKGVDINLPAETKRTTDVKKNVAAAKSTPPKLDDVGGLNSDKGGIQDTITPSKLDESDLAALPASVKARLRGDFL